MMASLDNMSILMQIREISDTFFINNSFTQSKPHVISAAVGQEVASKIILGSKKGFEMMECMNQIIFSRRITHLNVRNSHT